MKKIIRIAALAATLFALTSCDLYESKYRIFNTTPEQKIYVDGLIIYGKATVEEEENSAENNDGKNKKYFMFTLYSERGTSFYGNIFARTAKCFTSKGEELKIKKSDQNSDSYNASKYVWCFEPESQNGVSLYGHSFSARVNDKYMISVTY